MKTVLFACIHNAGRSQMAAAWLDALSDPTKARAISAGTEPGPRVHPEVLEAMREVGVDLSAVTPQKLTDELAATACLLVTMGCGEACPYVPGLRRDDWPLEDPKGKPIERVRAIRDEVKARVEALLDAVRMLVTQAELPDAGLVDQFPAAYVVARRGPAIVGVAGLETYDGAGLLRSVAVAAELRGAGLGRALVADRMRAARERGLEAVYLLTTTAADWFRALGFSPSPREGAPAALGASPEFAKACPASAACLVLRP